MSILIIMLIEELKTNEVLHEVLTMFLAILLCLTPLFFMFEW